MMTISMMRRNKLGGMQHQIPLHPAATQIPANKDHQIDDPRPQSLARIVSALIPQIREIPATLRTTARVLKFAASPPMTTIPIVPALPLASRSAMIGMMTMNGTNLKSESKA